MKRNNVKRWAIGGSLLLVLMAVAIVWRGYPRTFEFAWDEEVQLHDGTVVVINYGLLYERLGRWSRYEHSIQRESRLQFTPAGGGKPRDVRFPHLRVMVFDVVDGVTYLVLTDTSGIGSMPDRSPFPVGEGQGNYRALRWSGDRFVAIPLKELPTLIVARNLLWDTKATTTSQLDSTLLTLSEKSQLNARVAVYLDAASKQIVRNSGEPASPRR